MKNIKTYTTLLALLIALSLSFTACNDVEDPPAPNEEELITTVKLTFTNTANASDIRTFSFADPDGEGGNAPTKTDTIRLSANSTYTLGTQFLDESNPSNVVDITAEVLEEANDHLVCYSVNGETTLVRTDKDGNNLVLGLKADVSTKNTGNEQLIVSLKHQPSIKNGECEVGETDVEVTFVLLVE